MVDKRWKLIVIRHFDRLSPKKGALPTWADKRRGVRVVFLALPAWYLRNNLLSLFE